MKYGDPAAAGGCGDYLVQQGHADSYTNFFQLQSISMKL